MECFYQGVWLCTVVNQQLSMHGILCHNMAWHGMAWHHGSPGTRLLRLVGFFAALISFIIYMAMTLSLCIDIIHELKWPHHSYHDQFITPHVHHLRA